MHDDENQNSHLILSFLVILVLKVRYGAFFYPTQKEENSVLKNSHKFYPICNPKSVYQRILNVLAQNNGEVLKKNLQHSK